MAHSFRGSRAWHWLLLSSGKDIMVEASQCREHVQRRLHAKEEAGGKGRKGSGSVFHNSLLLGLAECLKW